MSRFVEGHGQPVAVVRRRHPAKPVNRVQREVDRVELDVRDGVYKGRPALGAAEAAARHAGGVDQLRAVRPARGPYRFDRAAGVGLERATAPGRLESLHGRALGGGVGQGQAMPAGCEQAGTCAALVREGSDLSGLTQSRSISASAKPDVDTSVAFSIWRAKS
jgi:hypothetical protein